jgi:DNA gyrase/topoisomerase IV subunit A
MKSTLPKKMPDGCGPQLEDELSRNWCDCLDNTCDGLADESFPLKGQVCTVGTGRCKRAGRYACNGAGDGVICASSDGHVLGVAVEEIPALAGAGKGAIVMDVAEGERLVGAALALSDTDRVTLETDKGKEKDVKLSEVIGRRANKGTPIVKRDRFARLVPPPVVVPTLEVS